MRPVVGVLSLHLVVLLWRGEDPLVSDVDFTERPAPVALLVEQRHRRHDDGADGYGLAVGDDGLLGHHVTHILDIPATTKSKTRLMYWTFFLNTEYIFFVGCFVFPTSCERVLCQEGISSWRTCRRLPQLWWRGDRSTGRSKLPRRTRPGRPTGRGEVTIRDVGEFVLLLTREDAAIAQSSSKVTYQTVYYTDVPLVLFEP